LKSFVVHTKPISDRGKKSLRAIGDGSARDEAPDAECLNNLSEAIVAMEQMLKKTSKLRRPLHVFL